MGEHAALGHTHRIGQLADGQAFQPVATGYAESALDDQFARGGTLGGGDGKVHGGINSTTVRFIQTRSSDRPVWMLHCVVTIRRGSEIVADGSIPGRILGRGTCTSFWARQSWA